MTNSFMFAHVTCLEMMKITNNNLIRQLSTKLDEKKSKSAFNACVCVYSCLNFALTECTVLKDLTGRDRMFDFFFEKFLALKIIDLKFFEHFAAS